MKLAYKLGLICWLLGSLSSATSAQLRTVVLFGDPAPGTTGGNITFDSFGSPMLNSSGQVAFKAVIQGIGVNSTNDTGIWSEGSGSLSLVARAGDPAVGTLTGVNFSGFEIDSLVLNSAGQTAFIGELTDDGVDISNSKGVWSEGSGSLKLVARVGSHPPGVPSTVNYERFSSNSLVMNSAGQTAFFAELAGGGVDGTNNFGIWSEGSGSLALIARRGSRAPGTPSGVFFEGLSSLNVLNSNGQSAFDATVTGNGITSTNEYGIWLESSGSLDLVVPAGNHAPGTPSDVNFIRFFSPELNPADQIAFFAFLTGSSVNATNNTGIWSGSPDSLTLLARTGSQATGTPLGVNYNFFQNPVLNSAGRTAFFARLTGGNIDNTNDNGVWSDASGSLSLVARAGDHAPGTPSGVNFSIAFNPALNSAGQTAFSGWLAGTGIDNTNREGIWAEDRSGTLRLIARSGDPLEVAQGDFRTIGLLGITNSTGNESGRRSSFNDLGQLVFWASFTDGTLGIFVSDLATLPEPSSLLLVATATFALLLLKTQRS